MESLILYKSFVRSRSLCVIHADICQKQVEVHQDIIGYMLQRGILMKKCFYPYFIVLTVFGGVVCAFLPSIVTAKIIFVSYQDGIPSINIMDDNSSNVQRITFIENADSHISTPVWSPNGKRIAFTRSLGLPTLNDLFIMFQDGSDVQQLANEPDTYYAAVAW